MNIPSYEYQEIRVDCYEAIYKIVNDYNLLWHRNNTPGIHEPPVQPFFRGQAIATRKIQASITFMKEKGAEIIRVPDITTDSDESLFELIARIQHYHTGTRFVDFTTDINVAIYFACEKHFDIDGAVYVWSYAPHLPEWYTTAVICELEMLLDRDVISIRELSEILLKKYPRFSSFIDVDDLSESIASFLDSGMMVLPDEKTKRNNERLYRQKGAFFICPPMFTQPITSSDRWRSNAGNLMFIPDSAVDIFDVWDKRTLIKLIIPKELKIDLLQRLKAQNITKEYLLPDAAL